MGEGLVKQKTEISLVRALSSSALCVMDDIVHVTPRTAVAKNPFDAKKTEENEGKRACVRQHGARCQRRATRLRSRPSSSVSIASCACWF
jgi:hypothetical protein